MATQTVQAVDHKLLAAGEWIETGEWDEVRSPYDGTPVGRVAQGDAALVDRAARTRAARPSSRPTSPQHARAEVLDRAAELVGERVDDLGPDDRRRGGQAAEDRDGRGAALRRHPDLLRGRGAQADRRHGPDGGLGLGRRQARGHAAGPLRRRRRDQPLQLPAQPRRPQARAGDRGRQRGRPQARRPDADLGAEAGRDPARGRACPRAGSASSRGPARRSATRSSSTS